MTKHIIHCCLTVSVLLTAQPLSAAPSSQCAGVRLPDKERAFGVDLVLNGMGIRTVSIFNIRAYVAALYLEKRTRYSADALKPEHTKLVVLTFLRDAERAQMIETIRSGLDSQPARIKQLAAKSLPELERRLPDPRKGGSVTFAYSQGRLELRHNNKVTGSWNDPGLAEAMFSAWLGSTPVDAAMKAGLLGGECE
jgi:hypothetical protein